MFNRPVKYTVVYITYGEINAIRFRRLLTDTEAVIVDVFRGSDPAYAFVVRGGKDTHDLIEALFEKRELEVKPMFKQ